MSAFASSITSSSSLCAEGLGEWELAGDERGVLTEDMESYLFRYTGETLKKGGRYRKR
jgi:hypothetical protein